MNLVKKNLHRVQYNEIFSKFTVLLLSSFSVIHQINRFLSDGIFTNILLLGLDIFYVYCNLIFFLNSKILFLGGIKIQFFNFHPTT